MSDGDAVEDLITILSRLQNLNTNNVVINTFGFQIPPGESVTKETPFQPAFSLHMMMCAERSLNSLQVNRTGRIFCAPLQLRLQ